MSLALCVMLWSIKNGWQALAKTYLKPEIKHKKVGERACDAPKNADDEIFKDIFRCVSAYPRNQIVQSPKYFSGPAFSILRFAVHLEGMDVIHITRFTGGDCREIMKVENEVRTQIGSFDITLIS